MVQTFDVHMFERIGPMAAITATPRTVARSQADDAHGLLGLGGLRLTARGRAVMLGLAAVVSAVAGLAGTQAVASSPGEPLEVRVHTVAPGETLWGLALGVRDAGQDVRDVVADIRDINGLRGSQVEAGQVVLLPAE
jgi:hypothetical protein